MFGAGAAGALRQRVGGTAAPDAVCGANTRGRVGPGANQPGHSSCGHCGGVKDMNGVLVRDDLSDLVHEVAVRPACADLNRPHCDFVRFKSHDGESEAPFTLKTKRSKAGKNSN